MMIKKSVLRVASLAGVILLIALLGGCAHPITLSPDLSQLTAVGNSAGTAKVDAAVGLSISDEDKARQVTSAGGGGDKLSYLPYRDLETGLYAALSASFSKVSKVNGLADPKIQAQGIRYVIQPSIATTSYSGSIVTWPPTIFTVDLSCQVLDTQGRKVTEVHASGDGRAEFDEFKHDTSLSARRAALDALNKLVKAFADAAQALR